jgi:hypothetical protein
MDKVITYTYRGDVERSSVRRRPARPGRPTTYVRSYVWKNGYSATSPNGLVQYPWMTRSECREDAKAQGAKAAFEMWRPTRTEKRADESSNTEFEKS